MSQFVATKARVFVTLATAGSMVAGVAGLQAHAVQLEAQAEAESVAQTANTTTIAAPTPTATVVKKKKKKKKKSVATVVVQQAPAKAAKPAKNHGSSSGSQ
jgi:HAMP domain-containing protein